MIAHILSGLPKTYTNFRKIRGVGAGKKPAINKRIFCGLGIVESTVAFILGIIFFVLTLNSYIKLWPLILLTVIVLFLAKEVSLE